MYTLAPGQIFLHQQHVYLNSKFNLQTLYPDELTPPLPHFEILIKVLKVLLGVERKHV